MELPEIDLSRIQDEGARQCIVGLMNLVHELMAGNQQLAAENQQLTGLPAPTRQSSGLTWSACAWAAGAVVVAAGPHARRESFRFAAGVCVG